MTRARPALSFFGSTDLSCHFFPFSALDIDDRSSSRTTIAVMSNLETSVPTPNSATAETQLPVGDGQGIPPRVTEVTEPPKSKKKCLVLSLIRHGQVHPLLISYVKYISYA